MRTMGGFCVRHVRKPLCGGGETTNPPRSRQSKSSIIQVSSWDIFEMRARLAVGIPTEKQCCYLAREIYALDAKITKHCGNASSEAVKFAGLSIRGS
jgi:hypothetical protein